MRSIVVLVHSPLVGPYTWSFVAKELRQRAILAIVPELINGDVTKPYWRQHADAVADHMKAADPEASFVLVGHSGAGPLLPAVREAAGLTVSGYIFVDAGIARDGASRLDLLGSEAPELAEQLVRLLASGGRYPDWSATDLREILPNSEIRQRVLGELRPRALPFWQEALPVFAGWPDAPCAYLQFSGSYDAAGRFARQQGWPYQGLIGATSTCLSIPRRSPMPCLISSSGSLFSREPGPSPSNRPAQPSWEPHGARGCLSRAIIVLSVSDGCTPASYLVLPIRTRRSTNGAERP